MSVMLLDGYLSKGDYESGEHFSGFSGKLLRACLHAVGISYNECIKEVVFPLYPPGGSFKGLCQKKKDEGYNPVRGRSAVAKGYYLNAGYQPHLDRITTVIEHFKPTIIVALGAEALWYLSDSSNLKSVRGTTFTAMGRKVLATFSPEDIVRDWKSKPIFLADLTKVAREQHFPEVRRPARKVFVYPDIEDLYRFEEEYISPSDDLSIDIETSGRQITCIGFAPSKDVALVVPFTNRENKSGSYWRTREEEFEALMWVKHICGLKKAHIVGQNFTYDMNHLWSNYGIQVPHASDDTMLLHHAMQPELQKGLGFLGSIYTDEASWKFMRKAETIKRED